MVIKKENESIPVEHKSTVCKGWWGAGSMIKRPPGDCKVQYVKGDCKNKVQWVKGDCKNEVQYVKGDYKN